MKNALSKLKAHKMMKRIKMKAAASCCMKAQQIMRLKEKEIREQKVNSNDQRERKGNEKRESESAPFIISISYQLSVSHHLKLLEDNSCMKDE